MCNVIYIAGVPASGKTTIFREIREALFTPCIEFKNRTCRGIQKESFYMLGVFDGSTFEGTDKLSMTCIDDCIKFVKSLPENSVVFVEGDRLFNKRFIKETSANVFIISASAEELKRRHLKRKDTQSLTFLKGRRTKIQNLATELHLPILNNENESSKKRIIEGLIKLAKRYINQDT